MKRDDAPTRFCRWEDKELFCRRITQLKRLSRRWKDRVDESRSSKPSYPHQVSIYPHTSISALGSIPASLSTLSTSEYPWPSFPHPGASRGGHLLWNADPRYMNSVTGLAVYQGGPHIAVIPLTTVRSYTEPFLHSPVRNRTAGRGALNWNLSPSALSGGALYHRTVCAPTNTALTLDSVCSQIILSPLFFRTYRRISSWVLWVCMRVPKLGIVICKQHTMRVKRWCILYSDAKAIIGVRKYRPWVAASPSCHIKFHSFRMGAES